MLMALRTISRALSPACLTRGLRDIAAQLRDIEHKRRACNVDRVSDRTSQSEGR